MALLTIVLPVHGVEAYLPECLDSILGDPSADIEVVAVDDRSPDGSAEILRRYADRDVRLRVVTLSGNVGLGRARNAGLAHAAGDYVWFVDSDDWLAAGAVAAVLSRLRELRPEVLLIDHDRVYADGDVELDPSSVVLRGVDGVVDLDTRPELLRLQHTAWNKIVSVELLRRTGIRFPPGWYEDFPFSHPVLITADRIAVLDQVCYHYRRGRRDAITTSVSNRHFEAVEQYRNMFQLLEACGPRYARHRQWLFRLMIDHCLAIAGNTERLPGEARRQFFHQVVVLYRTHRPEGGYPTPGKVAGLKHALIRVGWYPAYAAMRLAYRLRARTRARPHAREAEAPAADTHLQPL